MDYNLPYSKLAIIYTYFILQFHFNLIIITQKFYSSHYQSLADGENNVLTYRFCNDFRLFITQQMLHMHAELLQNNCNNY